MQMHDTHHTFAPPSRGSPVRNSAMVIRAAPNCLNAFGFGFPLKETTGVCSCGLPLSWNHPITESCVMPEA